MPNRRILPLGFIDRTTEDGAIIMLNNPNDSHSLSPETPITLLTHSTTRAATRAGARGVITAIGYVTARFKVVETRTDPDWPDGEQVLRRGTPVYQALDGSFKPDPSRSLTDAQEEGLRHLAARYRDATRPQQPRPDSPLWPSRNGKLRDQ